MTSAYNKKLYICMGLISAVLTAAVSAAQAATKHYVIIVANNNSLDDGTAPLLFADDDGARYFELFLASGADTRLLTVLDADAQITFPTAAKAAKLPKKENLLAALASVFQEVERANAAGLETHFTFVYAGHGNVGPNREGYIHLLDERLDRRMFYKEVIAASPAGFNHIILDACHAYYLVNKRGDKRGHRTDNLEKDIQDFLAAELLDSYPNTGVILAASKDSETHEWRRLESGIFSHELISALLGAGDVNEDGIVTYQEAAACVEAANSGVRIPKARLNVYVHPPKNRQDIPLSTLTAFGHTPTLRFNKEMGGRYYIEDARGVRIADLHFTREQDLSLMLVGQAPFYVRTQTDEAEIVSTGITESAQLAFRPISDTHRGSLDDSFRKHLFEVPFGIGFYLGMNAATQHPSPSPVAVAPDDAVPRKLVSAVAPEPTGHEGTFSALGWIALGAGVGAGIVSGVLYGAAARSHDKATKASDAEEATSQLDTANKRVELSRLFMGLGIGLAVTGGTLLILKLAGHPHRRAPLDRKRVSLLLAPEPGAGGIGVLGRF